MVVDTHLYDILGVDPSIDDRSLKKAYAKKALECHPDKHPDDPQATEKFQQLNEAWEILKDPERRRIYDEHGVEGLRQNTPSGFDDILSHLFGFGQPTRRRTRDIVRELPVTLEELFNGAEKSLSLTRHVPCKSCQGTGCKPGVEATKCEKCDGQGQVIAIQDLGGQYLRQIVHCPNCHGEGVIVPEGGKCDECYGRCLVTEDREFSVHIERGMEGGNKIVFQGVADEVPQADTGDLIVVVEEEGHPVFERKHSDLLFKKQLTLSQALFGARFVIEHLDNRRVVVTTDPSKVIQPGAVQVIPGEGMPLRSDQCQRGNLFIHFSVTLPHPKSLTREFKRAFLKALPLVDEADGIDVQAEDVVVVTPQGANLEQFENAKKEKREQRNEAYRDDDGGNNDTEEQEGGGPEVACRPM
jgi:DnaJ-class molecular chaperone